MARRFINRVELEEEIRIALNALMTISSGDELVPLEYTALHIDEKITPDNFLLRSEIRSHVVQYYRFIEKQFSEADADFDLIASEVKMSSMKLERAGMSQEDAIKSLSEWINNKSGLGEKGNIACNIVVSFFIQNCDVFYK